MKIILRKDYEGLGKAGDTVTVKDGYAQTRSKKAAEQLAEELAKVSCTATVTVGEEDKVFGSVTAQHIADLLKEKGYEIDRKKIKLSEPIKALGIYDVPIKLHQDVETKIKLWVVKE